MSVSEKYMPEPGSQEQLDWFAAAWKRGKYACPACGRKMPLDTLSPLTINECPHCKDSFFMPRDWGLFTRARENIWIFVPICRRILKKCWIFCAGKTVRVREYDFACGFTKCKFFCHK